MILALTPYKQNMQIHKNLDCRFIKSRAITQMGRLMNVFCYSNVLVLKRFQIAAVVAKIARLSVLFSEPN